MNRFKLLIMTMNRFRLLLITTLVVAVTALSTGINVTYAQQDPSAQKLTDEQKATEAKRKADAATRALAKKAEIQKQRKAAREYVRKVVEGQQPGAATPAPDNAGQGGAK